MSALHMLVSSPHALYEAPFSWSYKVFKHAPPHQSALAKLNCHVIPCFELYFLNNLSLNVFPSWDHQLWNSPLNYDLSLTSKKVIVFRNSIIWGIRKFKSFPGCNTGCNSKEMFYYIEPTIEIGFYDSAIFHVGVNDLLSNKWPSSTDNLVSNLVNIVKECKSFGEMDLFVSGIKKTPIHRY